jgi:SAM-dependent methyltransferase
MGFFIISKYIHLTKLIMGNITLKEKLREIIPGKFWNVLQWIKKHWLIFFYRYIQRPDRPGETTKAKARREKEQFFELYCKGKGLDIGFGGDKISANADGFDFEHGDAQFINGINDESYDFVYSSHTLEHLQDPNTALKRWFRVVKPGGYMIISIPHRDLYEKKKTLPSRFNPTHLHFFLPDRDEEPDTIGVLQMIERSISNFELIYLNVCNEGFTITDPDLHSNGEYSIEVVLRKKK